jgi:hypothetical protein
MKSKWQLSASLIVGAAMMTSAISVAGQQKTAAGAERKIAIERSAQGDDPQGPPPPDHMFTFITSEMNFDGKLVKGAPYSAQGVTETTQTLSDGNRIVNKSTSVIYRDSEGRTRRENTLQAIGPFATGGEPVQTISINDPVAGVNYSLDPRTHVAHKMAPMRFEFKIAEPSNGETHPRVTTAPTTPGAGVRIERSEVESQVLMRTEAGPGAPGGGGGAMVMEYHVVGDGKSKAAKTESLGKQSIEGVDAEGSRTTVTIAAGEMGNERPIEIVSERWYSPELQVVVMTRHSDPRSGETIYKLTNINRSEPAKSLFEVPAEYTIQESPTGPAMQRMKLRKSIEEMQ